MFFHPLFSLYTVGEAAAGKASRSLAQHIPGQGGMEGIKAAAGGAVGELARARIALDERGQRLGELEDRTALMMSSAETFSKHAHEVRRNRSNTFSNTKTLNYKHMLILLLTFFNVPTADAEMQRQEVVSVLDGPG